MIPPWVEYAVASATTVLALWRGGWRERAVAVVQQLQVFLALNLCAAWACPAWRPLADDGVMLAVCLACALRGQRYWTIPASSFALLAVVTDLAALQPRAASWPLASADAAWMYLLSAAILWGVWTSGQDRARQAAGGAPLAAIRWRAPARPMDRSAP